MGHTQGGGGVTLSGTGLKTSRDRYIAYPPTGPCWGEKGRRRERKGIATLGTRREGRRVIDARRVHRPALAKHTHKIPTAARGPKGGGGSTYSLHVYRG